MRVFKSGVKVIGRTRVCVLLVLIFVCSIDRSNSVGTAAETKTDQLLRRHPSSLTPQQVNSALTIEFSFKHIDPQNKTAVEVARREVRRKILEYLKSGISTTASPAYSTTAAQNATIVATAPPPPTTTNTTHSTATITLTSTTVTIPTTPISSTLTTTTTTLTTTPVTSLVEGTTKTQTTASTTTVENRVPPPQRKRKRRNGAENNNTVTEEDIIFVENDIEIDENGILRISLSNNTELGDLDLLKILESLNDSDNLTEIAPVVKIYSGLPPVKAAMAMAGFKVWLPILLVIVLLLVIFIFVGCWVATNKKVKDEDRKKMIPQQDSKPSPSNGQAPKPRILTDNDGYFVPMEQFNNE